MGRRTAFTFVRASGVHWGMGHRLASFALLLLVATPTAALAQPAVEITGWLSRIDSTGENVLLEDSTFGDIRFEISSGAGFGASVGLRFTPRISGDLTFMSLEPEAGLAGSSQRLDLGKIDMRPIMLTVRAHLSPDSALDPYIGAGPVYVTFGRLEGTLVNLFDFDQIELENEFGILLNAGASIRFSPNWAVAGDVRYFPLETRVEVVDDIGVDIELNPLILSIGLKYTFRK